MKSLLDYCNNYIYLAEKDVEPGKVKDEVDKMDNSGLLVAHAKKFKNLLGDGSEDLQTAFDDIYEMFSIAHDSAKLNCKDLHEYNDLQVMYAICKIFVKLKTIEEIKLI